MWTHTMGCRKVVVCTFCPRQDAGYNEWINEGENGKYPHDRLKENFLLEWNPGS